MVAMVSRPLLGSALLVLVTSCAVMSPTVETETRSGLAGYDLVYFTYGASWSPQHTMTEVLQQEFERRRFVVLNKEPTEQIRERTLLLRLDTVEDARRSGQEQKDRMGQMAFRLERMVDGVEVGRASCKSVIGLDRIEQRAVAEKVVHNLLKKN
jgi:hypothetical protein